ncbi:MAG: hypothetical protein AAF787_09860 [Chloroflexota bacterium]
MTEQKRQKVHKPDGVIIEYPDDGIRIRLAWKKVYSIWDGVRRLIWFLIVPVAFLMLLNSTQEAFPLFLFSLLFGVFWLLNAIYIPGALMLNETIVEITDNAIITHTAPIAYPRTTTVSNQGIVRTQISGVFITSPVLKNVAVTFKDGSEEIVVSSLKQFEVAQYIKQELDRYLDIEHHP